MSSNRKWWLLPPAVALLLVLGPLSMPSRGVEGGPAAGSAAATPPPAAPAAAPDAAAGDAAPEPGTRPALPRTPDLWQVASTLLGVLLLGGAAVVVLRRLRGPAAAAGHGVVVLRQSLRLSNRRALHAVEFEGRLLLIGEAEHGIALLQAGAPPEQAADEAAVAARPPVFDDEDGGAVPKDLVQDLVLPRPPARTARPAARSAAARTPAPRGLGDFRALLAKAGR